MANEKAPVRRKISAKTVKLSDQAEGFKAAGKFVGLVLGAPFSKVNDKGEIVEKRLTSVVMEDLKTGERIAYIADKGLTGGLTDAAVKEGDHIEFVKLPKTKLSNSRTMNQYDIFALA